MARFALETARTCDLAIDAAPDRLLIVDSGGSIVLANRELAEYFGYTKDELVGRQADLLLSRGEARPDAATTGTEVGARRKDGAPLKVVVDWQPLSTPDAGFMLAFVHDADATTPRQSSVPRLDDQFEFARLVEDLTTQFNNVPTDRIGDAISAGVRRVCTRMELDRCAVVRIGTDNVPFASIGWSDPESATDAVLPTAERYPWSLERILAGDIVSFSSITEIPSDVDRDSYAAATVKSAVIVPLSVDRRVAGAIEFGVTRAERTWPAVGTHRLRVIAAVFSHAIARRLRDEARQAATAEAGRLREELHAKTASRHRSDRSATSRVVGQSAVVRQVLDKIQQVSAMDSTVLLLGETGTGKELFASQIHETGSRHARQMIRVNCAAIPTTLIESELFGREKGAFTGSLSRQIGRFEMADHSTLFLDEIGDLPAEVQVKLLRVLEERKFERLGSPRSITVDTRIIAATHRNLESLMASGTFREDLYYRLSVFPIHVPPLRDRLEDIPLLVWRFVEEFSSSFGKRIESIDADSIAALQQYSWPGNIRELRNVVERAMIVSTGPRLAITPPHGSAAALRRSAKLVDVEKEHIRSVVESTGWRIRGAGGAADRLGLRPTTLETRMAKLGLRRPQPA